VIANRRPRSGDDGATLIIVLILITVFATVVGVVLSQTDTSLLATRALRDQAAMAYSGDGGAQIAIKNVTNDTFLNTANQKCFSLPDGSTSNTLPLISGQFKNGDGSAESAVVTCSTDPTSGAGGTTNLHSPGQAILTLGTSAVPVNGLTVTVNGGGNTYVQGKIYSYSSVNVTNNTTMIDTNSSVQYGDAAGFTAKPPCGQGTVQASDTPPCKYNATKPTDPNYALPSLGIVPAGVIPAACTTGGDIAYFRPGRFTDPTALSNCKATIMSFLPNADGSNGLYFFDFPASNPTWTVTQALVGGTLVSGFNTAVRPTTDGSCVDPINPQGGTAQPGVEFVFGGASKFNPSKATGGSSQSAVVEICGSRETFGNTVAGQPPIALYSPKSDVKDSTGATVASAETTGTTLITTTNGDKPVLFLRGTAYAPKANLIVYVANASKQLFNFGIISQALTLSVNPQVSGQQLIYVDNTSDGSTPTPVVTLLRVYTCAGTVACPTTGTPQLAVKVSIAHATGIPAATTVLSWSQTR
jgi:hypothetical protein